MRPGLLHFDGGAVGGPVPSLTGLIDVAFEIPLDASPGPHLFAVVAIDDPASTLATLPLEVVPAGDPASPPAAPPSSQASSSSETSSGVPLAALLVGAAVLGAVALVVHGRDDTAHAPRRPNGKRGWYRTERIERVRAMAVTEPDPTDGIPGVVPAARTPYLLEHENPHAPLRPNGKRGWYRTQRLQPVRAIVVSAPSGSQSAADLAWTLTSVAEPCAAHVAIDADGAVELLPDDYVAVHGPDPDRAGEGLFMALVVPASDGTVDDAALRHLAAWCAPRLQAHDLPVRRIALGEWTGDATGLLSQAELVGAASVDGGRLGPEFPWDRFLAMDLAGNGKPDGSKHATSHAPRRPNGKRGWYRTQRTQPVRAVGAVAGVVAIAVIAAIASRGGSDREAAAPASSVPAEITTTVTTTVAGPPVRIDPATITASASSVLAPEANLTYGIGNTLDGKLDTAWNDGSPGPGGGEKLTYRFAGPVQLVGIRLVNGYAVTPELFSQNARIGAVVIVTDTGRFPATLADEARPQEVMIDLGRTSSVIIDVVTFHAGSHYEDLALTDIEFLARPV